MGLQTTFLIRAFLLCGSFLLLAAGLASAPASTFLVNWSEFLVAYTSVATEASRAVPVTPAPLPAVSEAPWGDTAAASILPSLPPGLIVAGLQRSPVRGLPGGVLKE